MLFNASISTGEKDEALGAAPVKVGSRKIKCSLCYHALPFLLL